MRLRLLGKPQFLDPATGTWRDLSRKAAALLARLAMDGALSRETLAAQLWPDAQGDKPRGSLRGLLRDLRLLTGVELVQGGETLELDPGVEHDLTLQAGPAADLPCGVLLAAHEFTELDDFSEWLVSARERLSVRLQRVLREEVTALESLGHLAEATSAAERLLEAEPLDESTHRTLMRLHCQRGNRAGALAAYGHCQQVLAAALQIQPSPPTRALATLIEAGEPLPTTPARRTEPSTLQPPQLVARELECQAIEEAWRSGHAVWLEGEAGIGKSQLLRHFAAGAGGVVLVSAVEGEGETPYGLFARVLLSLLEFTSPRLDATTRGELARLRPEFGPAATRPASTQRLAEAFAQALHAWHAGGLSTLLLDDLHWADTASTKMLVDAAAASSQLRWMIGSRPLAPAFDAAGSDAQRWFKLTLLPLDKLGVEKWLHALPACPADVVAWAGPLAAHSRGNALLLIEAMRAMRINDIWQRGLAPEAAHWPVNPSLETLLPTRLAQLAGPGLHLAQLVALSGAAFSHALALQVLKLNAFELATLWAELENQGVLQGDTLAHDTLRSPLVARVPPALLRELHSRIAEAAAQVGAEAAEVARHWCRAQNWAQAAACFDIAARRARALGARTSEYRLWEQAAECHERLGKSGAAFSARNEAFDALLAAASIDHASAAAQALLSEAESPGQQLDAALAMARACATAYRHADALAHAHRAVDLAISLPEDGRLLRARLLACAALVTTGHQAQALQQIEANRAAVLASADPKLELDFHSTRGYVCAWASRFETSIAAYTRALELAEWLDDCAEVTVITSNLVMGLVRRGDCVAALEIAQKGVAWRLRMGEAEGAGLAMSQQILAMLLIRMARHDQALVAAEAALGSLRAAPWRLRSTCETTLATVWLSLGRCDLARASLTPWPADAAPAGRVARTLAETAIDAAQGLPTWVALQAARQLAQAGGDAETTLWVVELRLAALADPESAITTCREIAHRAATGGVLSVEQTAWLREADALHRCGNVVAAAERLSPVLARLAHCVPIDIPMAEVWCLAARIFGAAGHEIELSEVLRRGSEWLREEALPHVPPAHRRSFLKESPYVAELVARISNAVGDFD